MVEGPPAATMLPMKTDWVTLQRINGARHQDIPHTDTRGVDSTDQFM